MSDEVRGREAALRELADRELARRRLLAYVIRMYPQYLAGWVHKELAAHLEQFLDDVVNKRSPRLMVFMPPRVGKSFLVSESFPPWALGRFPQLQIVSTSYSSSLVEQFSRGIRRTIREDERYQQLFPQVSMDEDTQAVGRWQLRTTDAGGRAHIAGGYRAVGVGGGLTGFGADILLIDDPVANADDANSEVVRESTWNWYATVARTRVMPGGGVLVVQTRWHDDDLSGRIIELMKQDANADQFKVISYPAIAEFDEPHRKRGEALHPERYDERAYAQIRASVGPTVWNALYQQNPVPDEGEFFKKDDIQYYSDLPPAAALRFYAAWDCAISERESADPTCGLAVAFDAEFNLYVVDRYYGRMGAVEIVDSLVTCQRRYSPLVHWMEKEKVQMALGPFIEHAMVAERINDFVIEPLPPGRRDKEARARTLQGLVRRRKVFLPRTAEWTPSLVAEMLRFPKGKHDDQVDALAYAALNINEVTVPHSDARDERKESWRDNLWKHVRGLTNKGYMAS